jgi:hypothetical protein
MISMNDLSIVWHAVERLLAQGISLVPVRDKDEIVNGDVKPAKSAIGNWKKYQGEIISKEALWHDMERFNTTAVAMVCGKVSGWLEILDIDVKYKPGIDAILFSDLQRLFPDLFNRLRIHRTPSGGYHILYRVKEHSIPGNEKLAGRNATEAELKKKPKEKIKNFLETRGEGGYAVAPPSLGYSIHQDVPIPEITWEERCSLIALCRSYNEVIVMEKPLTTTRYESNYYDENPFEHFNNSPAGEAVLEDAGWQAMDKDSNLFKWFTRPGKDHGVSASWNKQKRVFYIFTSSTELDPAKGYHPSTALSILLHGGDKRKTYQYLVNAGYGKVKRRVEQKAIRSKALTGKPLPANFSDEAHEQLQTVVATIAETYPYGIFWYEEEETIKINREKLYRVAEGLGFRLHNAQIVQIIGYKVRKATYRYFQDEVKAYIKEEDADFYEQVANSLESFFQRSGQFTVTRLTLLDNTRFLQSSRHECVKFYRNGLITITASGISFHDYQLIESLVWEDQINERIFIPTEDQTKSPYYRFLQHAIGFDPTNHLLKTIGYLSHDYKDGSMGYIIVLTESCPDPKHGGGSGKNIFSALLSYTISFKNIPGSQIQYNEKFLQAWNFERVFSISDVPKKFDFAFLKEISTGSGIVKKLYQDETTVTSDQMPKLIVSTNFSYEITDGGLKRRIIPIEFTDFFTKSGGVDQYFGAMFPEGTSDTAYRWTEEDWLSYDNIIAKSVQLYLAAGGKLSAPSLTTSGWMKQFDQTHWQLTREFIEEHWEGWKKSGFVSNDIFKNQYDRFVVENNIGKQFVLSSQRMNRALEDWCGQFGFLFHANAVKKDVHNQPVRGREITQIAPF